MPGLTGIDWTPSYEKVVFDEELRDRTEWVTGHLEAWTRRQLRQELGPDSSVFYEEERVQPDGTLDVFTKYTTMREPTADCPSDLDIGYSKNNPRIPSPKVNTFRDLALDELPQVARIPELSWVGPRDWNAHSLAHFVKLVASLDPGLARDWLNDIYTNPAIRHGLTGPGQLILKRTTERSPHILKQSFRREYGYYLEDASRSRDILYIAKTPPTVMLTAFRNRFAATNGHAAAIGLTPLPSTETPQ